MAICKQSLAFDVVFMLSWLLILITISILFSMYPELKIKNCKKKSSTYVFYFYSPSYYSIHYLHIIIAIFQIFKLNKKWIIH